MDHREQQAVARFFSMLQSWKSLAAASSTDRPSSEAITTTAISPAVACSKSVITALSIATVSARRAPGMSVTQVPSRTRGLGMVFSGSAVGAPQIPPASSPHR